MFDMDFKWAENIYQKFEDMYTEVDEILNQQEHFKYVEDQLQTVNANVKQFCSDLICDVLPPSSVDSLKGIATDIPPKESANSMPCENIGLNSIMNGKAQLGAKKPTEEKLSKSYMSEEATLKECIVGSNMSSLRAPTIPPKENGNSVACEKIGLNSNASSKVELGAGSTTEEKLSKSHMSEEAVLTKNNIGSDMSSLTCGLNNTSCEKACSNQAQMSSCISVALTAPKSSKIAEEIISNLNATADVSSAPLSSTSGDFKPCIFQIPDIRHHSGDAMSADFTERSDDSMSGEVSDDDVTKPGAETIQLPVQAKLEESCIMVDMKDLCSVSNRATKHRFLKKKLKQALTSMRSIKQRETWYDDMDAALILQNEESSEAPAIGSKDGSLNEDFCDSEWEII